MNITRVNKDSLNAVVTINIEKKDYFEKVEKILLDYRKSANIPGFRKGQVPMGLINKKYGAAPCCPPRRSRDGICGNRPPHVQTRTG